MGTYLKLVLHLNIFFRRIVTFESLQEEEEFTIEDDKVLQIGRLANDKIILMFVSSVFPTLKHEYEWP